MAMTDVEHSLNWSTVEEQIVYSDVDYTENECKIASGDDLAHLSTIIVENNQINYHDNDAPIVIYPNDPSVVGAEEEVIEEQEVEINWGLPPDAEEVVVSAVSESGADGQGDQDEIPLNDETYATYHPFPCDFCSRRFKKKANLINHMVAHQTQRPHGCNICTSRFMRKCDLVNHQKIHSYVPNRINRKDYDEEKPYSSFNSYGKKGKDNKTNNVRRRNSATMHRRSPIRGSSSLSSSPGSSPDRMYNNQTLKPTNYVDEDVQLLLEMTTKLHESRKSESSDHNVPPITTEDSPKKGTAEKPYVCSKCGRCFARESALVSHSQVHAEYSAYDCNKCGSRFFTVELLKEHYSKKHNLVYKEETSEEEVDNSRAVRTSSYTGDERFGSFYCNLCAISFHKLELLKQHKKMLHTRRDDDAGLYTCRTCQSMFLTNEKLLAHLESSVNCQQHVCMICGQHFSDQAAVQSHIQAKHKRDMTPWMCESCGKQCRSVSALKKHTCAHSVGRMFPCKKANCYKKFATWTQYKRHSLSHSNSKSVNCDECDEEFPDRRALLNHRHNHSYVTSRRFVCNECGKSFGSRSSQQIHNRIHTGERPYGCRYCWKAFADGGTLRKHERIHTGEKPYACAVCPRAFNQRVVLREHIRSHHSGPITKVGSNAPIFSCQVCGIYAANSEDLAMHLVQHSDENTSKNRTPQVGVRPYKRRQKTQLYNIQDINDDDFFSNSGSDMDNYETTRSKSTPTKRLPIRKTRNNAHYTSLSRTLDDAVNNIDDILEMPVKKAKMINTKLQANVGKSGKRGPKKRGRRCVEMSNVVTVVQKPRVRTLSGRLSGRGTMSSDLNETISENISDRTESVDEQSPTRRTVRSRNKNYDTDYELKPEEEDCTRLNSSGDLKIKVEPDHVESSSHNCGICNQYFTSKADLLFHVPFHI